MAIGGTGAGTCVATGGCGTDNFGDTDMVCKTCDSAMTGCKTCTANNACTACTTKKLAVDKMSCIDACPATSWDNNNACTACSTIDADCAACSAASTCTDCGTKKVAVGAASCIAACTSG